MRAQPSTHLFLGFSVSLVVATICAACAAQKPREYTDPATRMAWFHKHEAMTKTTEFGNIRWQFLGPKNISGRITDFAVGTPRGKTYVIYAASASGGVWKTVNEGTTWQPVFEEGPSTSIGDVTLAPSNQDIVWIGTGEANIFRSSMAGCGVFKSVDGGANWKHMGLAGTHTIPRIIIHPTNPDIVYVAASGHEWSDNPERGLYKSTDGGANWDKVLYLNEQTGVIDLVMHPDDPNTLYAATWQRTRRRFNDPRNEDGFSASGIFKTTDGGKNWQPMNKGLPEATFRGRIGIDICRSKPEVVYAFVDNYERAKTQARGNDAYGRPSTGTILGATIFRSDDGGKNWRQTSKIDRTMARHSGTYGWVFGQVRADPQNPDVVYTMGLGLNVSRDSGATLEPLGRRAIHGDHHALWIDPDNPNYLINGNDGGANISYDGGKTWRVFTKQLPLVQFFNVNYDMATPFRVYGSIQDHGSRRGVVDIAKGRRKIPAQDWERAPGGEGSHHFIDPRNADIVFACSFYGGISRNDLAKGRAGRTRIKLEAPEGAGKLRGQWLAPFILSPHDPDVLYHGMNYLFRSGNQGKDIEIISPDLTYNDADSIGDIPYHTITAIAESPVEKGVLFVGTDDGRAHLTMDDGEKWREIMTGLAPHRWISRIEASRFARGTVYMAQNGKRHDDFRPYLWKSTDYGKTWRSIVGNIPIGPINVVREDPKNSKVLYVGTDISVYISIDGGAIWHVLGRKLPSTFVSDLIIHPRDNIVVISTHGRGMFAMDGAAIQRRITALSKGDK